MSGGYGGVSSGFPMRLSPAPLITTFPQASLRSRKVGFPDSGSDPGASPRSSSRTERGVSADSHAPQPNPVYFQGRALVPRLCMLPVRLLRERPSTRSPFAPSRRYRARRGCLRHVRGRPSRVTGARFRSRPLDTTQIVQQHYDVIVPGHAYLARNLRQPRALASTWLGPALPEEPPTELPPKFRLPNGTGQDRRRAPVFLTSD